MLSKMTLPLTRKLMKPLRLLPRSLLTKSSTNMDWNLGSRMTAIEISQTALKSKVSSLRQDTSEIKSMMTDIYQAFKGQPSSAPSSSVTLTLTLINIPANVEGENATSTTTEEPPSHTEGETKVPTMANKRKGIATESNEDPSNKLVHVSTIIHLDPDEEVKVPYMINRKMYYLTDREMQAYLDKEEKMKKVVEEAKLLAVSGSEEIKVVREEAKKLEIHPKEVISTKAGEQFKKAQMLSMKSSRERTLKRSLSKGVSFVNNMVTEEPEYEIFFTNVFGDQAF
nr:hypothetical protein [Tanacetum cinerariifolium]